MKRYYIAYSSIFGGSLSYSTRTIARAVKETGGKNVRTARQYGWSNQPNVVTFSADAGAIHSIGEHVTKTIGSRWPVQISQLWK